ncbi:TolC family protein [Thiomonas arsenitoxydans]|uniref:TolC family protein n=1 Tax=Thiomonas arsenitoxydans (strain DSM 22701 / CIP 110005 / 3As) TaxID=426114 RepID=UPI001AD3CFC8|nr:TolC family protein [Thiomonas arsenitoxydans]MBN8775788.1 TolC family protein [Thiomonas arsenitoxydans]
MTDSIPRRVRVGLLAGACLYVLGSLASAQAETLDFRQAVDVALRQNPDLMGVQAQMAQARAGINQAEGAKMPKITVSAGVTRTNDALNAFGIKLSQRQATFNDFGANQFLGPQSLGVAPDNLNYPGSVNNFNTRIQAELPIYTGGKLQGYLQQARSMLMAAQAGDQAARQQIIYHALQAYDGVYTARAFKGVAGKALEAAQSQVKTVDSLFKQGVVIKSDLLSAQVRQEDVKLQQDQAADMEAQAMDALHVVLGVPLNQPITLGPEVMVTMPEGDPNAWVGQAMERNPKIQALQHQIAAAGGKIEVARADRYPQVGAMARFDTNDPNLGFESRSYTVGAQLNWTIFDGGVTRNAVDQAVAQRMELQAKLQSEQNQLGMQVQDSYRKAVDAANQVKTRELAVKQSEEAARIVSKRYADGVGTLVEVQGAQAQLDKARADLIMAKQQVNLQRAALRLAIGDLTLDATQPIKPVAQLATAQAVAAVSPSNP